MDKAVLKMNKEAIGSFLVSLTVAGTGRMGGAEQVIPGLDKAVMKMKKGEKALVTIGPEYAYGSQGATLDEGAVPPNATLQVELELISFAKVRPEAR